MPYKIKVDQKVLLKNQRRMDRKGGKFSFKWFSPFAVHSISNKNLCSLINKYGTLIKTKYNVYLLKSYLDSDETSVTNDETPLQCNRRTTTWYWKSRSSKFNPDTSADTSINCYAITNLPNEVIEMILVDTLNSSTNSIETYAIFSQTCSRFNDILKRKKDVLPRKLSWNFQIAFLTAYLVFTIRSKWAFEKSWKHLVRIEESQQAWLKLLMIRNGDLHGSPLILANTRGIHGIWSNVATGSWMKASLSEEKKNFIG